MWGELSRQPLSSPRTEMCRCSRGELRLQSQTVNGGVSVLPLRRFENAFTTKAPVLMKAGSQGQA